MARIALIDADELSYKHAFHYQRKGYVVKRGDKILFREKYKEDAVECVGNCDDLEIEEEIEVLDTKGYESRLDMEIKSILDVTGCSDFKFLLSGDNNFRRELATILPYKGNRKDGASKPFHLELFKTEFRYRGAETVDFLEADDLLAYYSTTLKDSVMCTSDKDLETVPNSFIYDLRDNKIKFISEDQSIYNFFYQLLIGDTIDNIPSPNGLGAVAATRFLQTQKIISYPSIYHNLVSFYSSHLTKRGSDGTFKTKWFKGYGVMELHEILWEVGNLIWMHRTLDPEERWELPSG